MSKIHKEREDVYVILRADLFHDVDTPVEVFVTPKEVVRSEDLARREVARLRALRPGANVRYWYAHSRLFPPGRSAGATWDEWDGNPT